MERTHGVFEKNLRSMNKIQMCGGGQTFLEQFWFSVVVVFLYEVFIRRWDKIIEKCN